METSTAERKHFPFRENGAVIRAARKVAGKSQERLASEVGTTRRHMIRLENGEHLPSSDLRNRIAEATGQSAKSIQSSEDDDEESDPAMREAFSLFVDLMARLRSREETLA